MTSPLPAPAPSTEPSSSSQPLSSAAFEPLLNPLQSGETPLASTIVEPSRSPNPFNPAFKPLLNPLQSWDTPPASTIVEPPRSPNPFNPATDEKGTNVEAGEFSDGARTGAIADGENYNTDAGLASSADVPLTSTSPIPSSAPEQLILSPLPPNAPMPPTPKAQDEVPPVLAVADIPPAVSTPTVITTEDLDIPAVQDAPFSSTPHILPDAFPTPAGTTFDPVPSSTSDPAPSAKQALPTESSQEAGQPENPLIGERTEVDATGQSKGGAADGFVPGVGSSTSTSSLKRAGGELEGRDEKRVKEDLEMSNASNVGFEIQPHSANGENSAAVPVVPWLTYVPSLPRPSGPITPLTVTQHKYLLNAIRSLKKAKDAPTFLQPVDTVLFGIPHYHQVVPRPMDLGTVETKLFVSDPRGPPKEKSRMSKWDESKGKYSSVAEVVEDVRQIWENTRKFNGPDHIVSQGASRLDETFEKVLNNLPSEPTPPTVPAPAPLPSPVAGPSTTPNARRASVSQPPVIRRTSDGTDTRPKREIHPPPSKDLAYADGTSRKPKRRNDPQLHWVSRTLKGFEMSPKFFEAVNPFLYPVSQIIAELPEYATVIKRPIDFNQIKERMNEGEYDDVSQVNADIRLMTSNAMKFNPPGHAVHSAAQQLLQAWDEKWRQCPSKQELRDTSEDPLAEDYEQDSDEEETPLMRKLLAEKLDIDRRIAEEKAHIARRKSTKGTKPKPKPAKASGSRKQSMPNISPGMNGNGHVKGPRKSKESVFRDDDDDIDSDQEGKRMTLTQKQELATKIEVADGDVLSQAIQIIQQSTNLGADQEIELDIDSLPPRTVYKLYNLVCRGGRKPGRPKSQSAMGQVKKTGRKGTGGVTRKHMNEQEEAERIKRMEAQLQSFEGGAQQQYQGEETDSSEEESSDED